MSLDLDFNVRKITRTVDECDIAISFNLTHNYTRLASALGVYEILWHPEISNYAPYQMLPIIERAIIELSLNMSYYSIFNPDNGVGTNEQFLPALKDIYWACKLYPAAEIVASR